MKNTKPITAEEYAAAIRLAEAEIACGGDLAMDSAARVLLALDGYLKDTLRKERESGDVWGCSDIALDNGLPVDEPAPCPECGGGR